MLFVVTGSTDEKGSKVSVIQGSIFEDKKILMIYLHGRKKNTLDLGRL